MGNFPVHSEKYFFNELLSESYGTKTLVTRAFHKSTDVASNTISDSETAFHIQMTQFLSSLTASQVAQFTHLTKCMFEPNTFISTCLPADPNEVSQFYLKGANSILNNIPAPEVFLKDGHACVSLTSVVNHKMTYIIN